MSCHCSSGFLRLRASQAMKKNCVFELQQYKNTASLDMYTVRRNDGICVSCSRIIGVQVREQE